MACFAVFQGNKQIRVYHYNLKLNNEPSNREQQKDNALKFAQINHDNGYPCTVEEFGLSGVGVLVFDSSIEKKAS